jgi:hypothetical protein
MSGEKLIYMLFWHNCPENYVQNWAENTWIELNLHLCTEIHADSGEENWAFVEHKFGKNGQC